MPAGHTQLGILIHGPDIVFAFTARTFLAVSMAVIIGVVLIDSKKMEGPVNLKRVMPSNTLIDALRCPRNGPGMI